MRRETRHGHPNPTTACSQLKPELLLEPECMRLRVFVVRVTMLVVVVMIPPLVAIMAREACEKLALEMPPWHGGNVGAIGTRNAPVARTWAKMNKWDAPKLRENMGRKWFSYCAIFALGIIEKLDLVMPPRHVRVREQMTFAVPI